MGTGQLQQSFAFMVHCTAYALSMGSMSSFPPEVKQSAYSTFISSDLSSERGHVRERPRAGRSIRQRRERKRDTVGHSLSLGGPLVAVLRDECFELFWPTRAIRVLYRLGRRAALAVYPMEDGRENLRRHLRQRGEHSTQ